MKKAIYRLAGLLVAIALMLFPCGCSQVSKPAISSHCVTIGKSEFTEAELCRHIENTVNAVLYYCGDGETAESLLNRTLSYALYYLPGEMPYNYVFPPKVRIVIENVPHPRSTATETYFYDFQIEATEKGLASDFCASFVSSQDEIDRIGEHGETLIGHYSMCLSTVSKPSNEIMSREWADAAENALRSYMNQNDFYSEKEDNLPSGEYHVYIRGFTAADRDSRVYFEHEDGRVYEGNYCFVHEVSAERRADLNHVALVAYEEADFSLSFERVKESAALMMEYTVA